MTARGAFRPARRSRAADGVVIAAALALVGTFAACGETRGVVLGDVPVVAQVDAAAFDAGKTGVACASCALPVTLSGASQTPSQGTDGGSPSLDLCPGNQVLVGFQGFLTPPSAGLTLIEGLAAMCAELSLVGPPPGPSTATAGATLAFHGASKGSAWTQICPADEVVVGFSGRSGSDLDQVAFECAPWTAESEGAPLSMGSTVTLPAAGGDGGLPFEDSCPSGQLARGTSGRYGQWVNALALVCATPTLGASDGGAL